VKHCKHQLAGSLRPGLPLPEEKSLLSALITSLDQPNAAIEKVLVGPTLVAVLAGERLGLSSHLGARPEPGQENLAEELTGRTCARAAELILESSAYEVAIGMAAVNAGLLPQAEPERRPIEQTVAELAGSGEAALVGQFPFTPWLKDNVGTLHLFELQQVDGKLSREKWDEVLARVSVAAITSTVFLTRHASYYLSRAKNASRIFIGPSTPLSPALFDFGADMLAGSLVTDIGKVLHNASAGGCFSEVFHGGGIQFVTMQCPGWRA
jgi:uncharacterized protein (DUF4213/DUF364 family)